MTIKTSRSAANQYLSIADSASLTLPDSDWEICGALAIDGITSGDNPQYVFSTGAYQATGAVNILYQTAGNGSPNTVQASIGTITLSSPTGKFLSGAKLVWFLQHADGALNLRTCLVKSTLPTDGTGVSLEGTATFTGALDTPSGIFLGVRADLNSARFSDQSIGRNFILVGQRLTDLDRAKIAYGMEITDLGKTPLVYVRMSDAGDISDRGSLASTVVPHGSFVAGTDMGFGYAGTAAAPVITGSPTIAGGASVGSASSYTPASVTGSPTPTRTLQWKLDGVAVSGATGTTYTPVSGDVGKTLTITQTETNASGPATATSAGVVVAAASSTIDVVQIPAESMYQRAAGGVNGICGISMSGTYTSTVPTSIEYQLYAEDGATVLTPWTAISGATIAGGAWSGKPLIPFGGMYRLCVRSKSGPAVLATSNIKANLFAVADGFICLGSSSPQFWFASDSGAGYTPAANVRMQSYNGGWAKFSTDGCAIQMANSLAAQAGGPVFMMAYGIGGTTLQDALNPTGRVWTEFTAGLAAAGGKVKAAIISTGSNDVANGIVQSRASHAANLRQLIANIRTITGQPTLDICLSGFNRRLGVNDTQADYARMAENDVSDDPNDPHVIGTQLVDLELRSDGIHLTTATFPISGQRITYVLGEMIYKGLYHRGPKATGFTFSGSTAYASLTHRNGTDIAPASSINGFTVTDGSGALVVTAARASANRIALTCNRALVAPVVVKYLSGAAPVSSATAAPTNEVFDTAAFALPMTVETDMATSAATSLATTVNFSVVDGSGAAVTGLVNLDYAFYDQPRISAGAAPVKYGTTISVTNGVGSISIAGVTSLAPGSTGRIEFGDSALVKAAIGQVTVS